MSKKRILICDDEEGVRESGMEKSVMPLKMGWGPAISLILIGAVPFRGQSGWPKRETWF